MWTFLISVAIALVASYALAPKSQSRPPAELEDLQAPVAEEGREIPVLFGCRDLRGPNVVWYGDLKTQAIRSEGGKK